MLRRSKFAQQSLNTKMNRNHVPVCKIKSNWTSVYKIRSNQAPIYKIKSDQVPKKKQSGPWQAELRRGCSGEVLRRGCSGEGAPARVLPGAGSRPRSPWLGWPTAARGGRSRAQAAARSQLAAGRKLPVAADPGRRRPYS
jgi:hypothetical protein